MKKIIFLLFVLLSIVLTSQPSHATRAKEGVVTVKQPDGSLLRVRINGDEFFNYYTTDDGYTISKGVDDFFYYASYDTRSMQLSTIRAGSSTKSAALARGVPQNVIEFRRSRALEQLRQIRQLSSTKIAFGATKIMPQKALVILVQYSDLKFVIPNPKQSFSNQLNQAGYSSNGGTGSAADYFGDNSMGEYRPEFVVSDVVTLPKSYKYYGRKDKDQSASEAAIEMVADACKIANAQGVNFADFDANSDGNVDLVFIYYAGYNAAEGAPEAVWPHSWEVWNSDLRLNGKRILSYSCTSELKGVQGADMCGIGTFCHEFGHLLGLPDLYDTESSASAAMWRALALMDAGNYNNDGRTPPYMTALERELLGWMKSEQITQSGAYSVASIDKNIAYRIDTDNPDEYYLLENRQNRGWDKYLSSRGNNPKGLQITHIDRSRNNVNGKTAISRWSDNTVNAFKAHQCADLVEACGNENIQITPLSDLFFPGTKNVTNFTYSSSPNNRSWSGSSLGYDITDITLEGDVVKFNVQHDESNILNINVVTTQTQAYVSWQTISGMASKWIVRWKKGTESDFQTMITNRESLLIEDVDLSQSYDLQISIFETPESEPIWSNLVTFSNEDTTAPYPAIMFGKTSYRVGDELFLVVKNVNEPTQNIIFTINGEKQKNQIYVFDTPGAYLISAEIEYATGDTEIINRRIVVLAK